MCRSDLNYGLIVLFFVIGSVGVVCGQSVSTDIKFQGLVVATVDMSKINEGNGYELTFKNGTLIEKFTYYNLNSADFFALTDKFLKTNSLLTPAQFAGVNYNRDLRNETNLRYIELISMTINTLDTGQKIADIEVVQKNITIYKMSSGSKLLKKTYVIVGVLKIDKVEITFEDAFITKIMVLGTDAVNKKRVFSNRYPIGILTRKNIKKLDFQFIYDERNFDNYRVKLNDVITYTRVLDVRTNDYSPKNQKITLLPTNSKELFKEPTKELLRLNVFSDFVGVNQENPNGLVQIEFERKIPVNSRLNKITRSTGAGILLYVTPQFRISKIEDNNRSMGVISNEGGKLNVSPIEIIRYSNYDAQLAFNGFSLYAHSFRFHADFVLGVSNTKVVDSVYSNTNSNIRTFTSGIDAKVVLNPSKSFSIEFGTAFTYLDPYAKEGDFRYVSEGKPINEAADQWAFSPELLGTIHFKNKGKLFARIRVNFESQNMNNGYSEFQVGYSYLFSTNRN